MRYATAGAFRTALEQRLVALAQQTGVPLVRLRKLVVFDRLTARLVTVAPDRWLLKGAVALHFRVGPHYRTTKDIDLGRQDNEEAATSDFLAAQAVDLGDYFVFAIERTAQPILAMEGVAVRYHATAELAGRRYEDVRVDVAFGDPAVTAPDLLRGPDLLGFADIAPAKVPVLPLEQHVAEKVHAYTRTYGPGIASTRVKDLIDLAMMSTLFAFEAGRLRQALRATFSARGTHSLSAALHAPPRTWRTAYRKMATETGLDPSLEAGHERARLFLDPVLGETVPDAARWDPAQYAWLPG